VAVKMVSRVRRCMALGLVSKFECRGRAEVYGFGVMRGWKPGFVVDPHPKMRRLRW